MHLTHLMLEQFRCYERLELAVPDVGLRLAGSNASGKTSLLEAIRLLSTMRSARAGVERELINWTSNEDFGLPPYSRVIGEWRADSDASSIEVALIADAQRGNHTRKQIKVDGHSRRAIDAVGKLKTVLFEPEDMDLILGAPSVRRRYLDVALSGLDTTYLRLLSQYNKILEQRNSLLKQLRDRSGGNWRSRMPELEYWDQELINRAAFIIAARIRFLNDLAGPMTSAFGELAGEAHALRVAYAPAADAPEGFEERIQAVDSIDAQRQVAQWLESTLESQRDEEVRRGLTVLGPHRDDLRVLLDGRDIDAFGSRGQQRIAVVSLKLAEVQAISVATGELPVLLLDDVLSELDEIRRERLLRRIGDMGGQVIVTATDVRFLQTELLERLPMFQVEAGALTPL